MDNVREVWKRREEEKGIEIRTRNRKEWGVENKGMVKEKLDRRNRKWKRSRRTERGRRRVVGLLSLLRRLATCSIHVSIIWRWWLQFGRRENCWCCCMRWTPVFVDWKVVLLTEPLPLTDRQTDRPTANVRRSVNCPYGRRNGEQLASTVTCNEPCRRIGDILTVDLAGRISWERKLVAKAANR